MVAAASPLSEVDAEPGPTAPVVAAGAVPAKSSVAVSAAPLSVVSAPEPTAAVVADSAAPGPAAETSPTSTGGASVVGILSVAGAFVLAA